MNKEQEARENMYIRVKKVLTEYETTWSAITPIAALIDRFDQYRTVIPVYKKAQERDIKGHAKALKTEKDGTLALFERLRNVLVAFSSAIKDEVLNEEVDYTNTDLSQGSHSKVLKRLQILLDIGQAHASSLAAYDLNANFLADCETQLNRFEEHIGNHANARMKRSLATQNLQEHIQMMQLFLKEELDPAIGAFVGTTFHKEYKKERRIQQPATRKQTTDTDLDTEQTPVDEGNTDTTTTNQDTGTNETIE